MSKADDLQLRVEAFALDVVKFCRTLPASVETYRIIPQMIAAGTSIATNYRAARRARSHAEFTAKIGVVAEEADESEYWLGLVMSLGVGLTSTAERLHGEALELTKIFGRSSSTARSHRR